MSGIVADWFLLAEYVKLESVNTQLVSDIMSVYVLTQL